MEAERQYKEADSRVIQPSKGGRRYMIDNRSQSILSPIKMGDNRIIQRDACLIPAQNSPYAHLAPVGGIGPFEHFDYNQRFSILEANFQGARKKFDFTSDADIQKDDNSGSLLIDIGTITQDIAEVDHILPKDLGGGNTPLNAQVLSKQANASKGNIYPWGKYIGYRVYDPAQNKIYQDRATALAGGADLTTLDSRGIKY